MSQIKSESVSHEILLDAVAGTFADWVEHGGVYDNDRCRHVSIYDLASAQPTEADLKAVREWADVGLYESLYGTEYADRTEDFTIDEELWGRFWRVLGALCRDYSPEKRDQYGNALTWAEAIVSRRSA